MIRVLHVLSSMNCGGTENLLMSIYRNIDRSKIQFDFLINSKEECFFSKEILALGGKIYYIQRYRIINHFSYLKDIKLFFDQHPEISIVHGHIASAAGVYIKEAKKSSKKTIIHCHATYMKDIHSLMHKSVCYFSRNIADYYFACSRQAAIDRFGAKLGNSATIIKNGIFAEKFRFEDNIRLKIRSENDCTDKFVIGHVGRFVKAKNHFFIVEIFKETAQRCPQAELWLFGEGELESEVIQRLNNYGLIDKVRFMGVQANVNEYMQAMDVFLFPSLYEGLGIALVEAQATGLACVVSDTIQPEAIIAKEDVQVIGLQESTKIWADALLTSIEKPMNRKNGVAKVESAGFAIENTMKWLSDFYLGVTK